MRSGIDTLLISDSVFIHSCFSLMPYKIMLYVDLRFAFKTCYNDKTKDFSNFSANNIVSRNYSIKETIQQMLYFRFLFPNDITIVINQNIHRHCFAKKGYFIACPNGTLEVVSSISFA